MSDKKNIQKILIQERKEKLGINQQNCFQTSERGSLLNLTKVRTTWINEHEYGKGRYYNEYYDGIFSGVTSQKTSLLFR